MFGSTSTRSFLIGARREGKAIVYLSVAIVIQSVTRLSTWNNESVAKTPVPFTGSDAVDFSCFANTCTCFSSRLIDAAWFVGVTDSGLARLTILTAIVYDTIAVIVFFIAKFETG